MHVQARQLIKDLFKNLLLICMGSLCCAYSVNALLIPNGFATGGFTGLAVVLHNLVPSINTGFFYILINTPIYILAWVNVGRRFFFYSLLGLAVLSCAFIFVRPAPPIDDPILSALFAGILAGTGSGIILRSYGSSGGADILGIIILKKHSIGLGTTLLATNCIVLLLVGFSYSLEAVLYSLIVLYVSSKVLNIVVTGLSQRKTLLIISPYWEAISKEILDDMNRGLTVIHGEGGYSNKTEHILYVVITFRELGFVKDMIKRIDPNAFVVVSDTMEVMNYRIGNQPHW